MRTVLNSLRHLRLRTNSFKSPSLFSSKIAWICIETSGAVTVNGACMGACTGTDTGKGIVTLGNDSTMVTVLEFLELELDAPLILFYYA